MKSETPIFGSVFWTGMRLTGLSDVPLPVEGIFRGSLLGGPLNFYSAI